MVLFKKKVDPISERARALNAEIAALEVKIQKLGGQVTQTHTQPRLRSTAFPHSPTVVSSPSPPPAPQPVVHEPVFEEVNQNKLKTRAEITHTPELYNELGVRKYDLAATFQRLKNHFHPPPAANPRLLNYLAAGSFQGLRPLRYEKRIARNRFILLVIIFFAVLFGIAVVFLPKL